MTHGDVLPEIDQAVFDLSVEQIDTLPVGVITLDRAGRVLRYNRTEAAFARRRVEDTVGKEFFTEIAPCTAVREFEGRFRAFACGHGNGVERFAFAFPFRWGTQDVEITLLRRAAVEEINLVVSSRLHVALPSAPVRQPLIAVEEPRHVRETDIADEIGEGDIVDVAPWSDDYASGAVVWSPELYALLECGNDVPPTAGGPHAFVHPTDAPRVERIIRDALAARKAYRLEYRIVTASGSTKYVHVQGRTFVDEGGRPIRAAGAAVDVTARRRREIELFHAASFDALTGLANRTLLAERTERALDETRNIGKFVGLLFIDLDNFKAVNDFAGHASGDELLRMTAGRLQHCVQPGDTVARLNGDEFVILLAHLEAEEQADRVAGEVIASISEPYVIDGRSHFVTASVGISVYPKDGVNADDLMRAADIAMYHSKERRPSGFTRFTSEIRKTVLDRSLMENELHGAVAEHQLELYYQPIVSRDTHAVVAAEALMRWNHPRLGMVMPAEFIPLAEANGSITKIGEWALLEACRQGRVWIDEGRAPIRMTVNVSLAQLLHRSLTEVIVASLERSGLPPDLLELELTESVAAHGFYETMKVLTDLKLLGVRLAIDDFGTGYSSLAYLKYFPINTLKLDRAFVANIVTDELDRAIASTVIALAEKLELDIIAEGVETDAQAELVSTLGCTYLQGYRFGRPRPAGAFWSQPEPALP